MTPELWPMVMTALSAPFVGSFLGTLALRLPDGRTVVAGRSCCDNCGTVLGPRELVPIASWLVQRGQCRHCSQRVSAFYPAMELGAAGVAAWAASLTDGAAFLFSCLLGWLLLTLAAMDLRHFRLHDGLVLALALGGAGATVVLAPEQLLSHLEAGALASASLAAIALAFRALRGRDGLGWGDVKFLGAAGLWVGLAGLGTVLLIASLTALTAVLCAALMGHSVRGDHRIAFGPFLAAGLWLTWLYGPLLYWPLLPG